MRDIYSSIIKEEEDDEYIIIKNNLDNLSEAEKQINETSLKEKEIITKEINKKKKDLSNITDTQKLFLNVQKEIRKNTEKEIAKFKNYIENKQKMTKDIGLISFK